MRCRNRECGHVARVPYPRNTADPYLYDHPSGSAALPATAALVSHGRDIGLRHYGTCDDRTSPLVVP